MRVNILELVYANDTSDLHIYKTGLFGQQISCVHLAVLSLGKIENEKKSEQSTLLTGNFIKLNPKSLLSHQNKCMSTGNIIRLTHSYTVIASTLIYVNS